MAHAKKAEENKQTQQNPRSTDRQTQDQPSRALTRSEPQRGLFRESQFTSPFSFMRRFSEEMDRLFDDFGLGGGLTRPGSFGRGSFAPTFGREFEELSTWTPQTEVFQRGNELTVRADLPGLTRDDITVDLDDNQIIIRGERKEEHDTDESGFYRSERSYGSFYRAIPLPDGIDADKAKADFNNGVLEITMPITELAPRGRRLEIGETGQQTPQARGKAAGR